MDDSLENAVRKFNDENPVRESIRNDRAFSVGDLMSDC
jgi:hypothetical protein